MAPIHDTIESTPKSTEKVDSASVTQQDEKTKKVCDKVCIASTACASGVGY